MGHTFSQHDINILDDRRISIFNNNTPRFSARKQGEGVNEVIIYDFDTDSYSKYLDEVLKVYEVRTPFEGKSRILDNGDLFIEEQNFGRMLYFNKDKSLQWQYVNRADNGIIYITRWPRILYKAMDIKKVQQTLSTNSIL